MMQLYTNAKVISRICAKGRNARWNKSDTALTYSNWELLLWIDITSGKSIASFGKKVASSINGNEAARVIQFHENRRGKVDNTHNLWFGLWRRLNI